MKTYSPSTEFDIVEEGLIVKIKKNRMIIVDNTLHSFSFSRKSMNVEDKDNYTSVTSIGESSDGYDWDFFYNGCIKKGTNFNGFLNKAFNQVYTAARDYDPDQYNLRRSLLEEKQRKEGENNEQGKATEKGYYFEDVQEGQEGHYKGFFLVDDELTIIEQTTYLNYGREFKLVLKLR